MCWKSVMKMRSRTTAKALEKAAMDQINKEVKKARQLDVKMSRKTSEEFIVRVMRRIELMVVG